MSRAQLTGFTLIRSPNSAVRQTASEPLSRRGARQATKIQEARRARLDRARQTGRHDLDRTPSRSSSACSSAKRAGHAGTLDPLASGDACRSRSAKPTKTVPFVVDGRKTYQFTVRWGEERDTDDAEGRRRRNQRQAGPMPPRSGPSCPAYTGTIEQVPPRFSAVKIDGERAYDLARDGETVELAPRAVTIYRLELVQTPDPDHALFSAECGKGTYVRSLARDLGRVLGVFGHVSALRPRPGRAVRRNRHDFAGTPGTLCAIEQPLARDASLTCSCRLRPRWTTSRRWP